MEAVELPDATEIEVTVVDTSAFDDCVDLFGAGDGSPCFSDSCISDPQGDLCHAAVHQFCAGITTGEALEGCHSILDEEPSSVEDGASEVTEPPTPAALTFAGCGIFAEDPESPCGNAACAAGEEASKACKLVVSAWCNRPDVVAAANTGCVGINAAPPTSAPGGPGTPPRGPRHGFGALVN